MRCRAGWVRYFNRSVTSRARLEVYGSAGSVHVVGRPVEGGSIDNSLNTDQIPHYSCHNKPSELVCPLHMVESGPPSPCWM